MDQAATITLTPLSTVSQPREGDEIRPTIAGRVQEALREYERLHKDLPLPDSPRYR